LVYTLYHLDGDHNAAIEAAPAAAAAAAATAGAATAPTSSSEGYYLNRRVTISGLAARSDLNGRGVAACRLTPG